MSERSDEALVHCARDGDTTAFAELVTRHTDRLYRVAYRLTGCAADAEDCVQETWLAVWRQLPAFRGDARVSTYLYRITANTALMQLRRQRPTTDVPTGAAEPAEDAEREPAAMVERSSARRAVQAGVRRLPEEQRVALVLREFEGLRYDEVAEVLSLSVAAVKSRLHRGRVALAAHLEAWR